MAKNVRDPKARERIVEAAATAVATRGVNGASMRVIAAQAGVSTGFITHYFDDKQELMEAVLTATNTAAARRVARAIATDKPALERLHAAAEALLPIDPQRRQEWQVWVAVWGEAAGGGSLAVGSRESWAGLREMLTAILVEAQEEEQIHEEIDVEYRAHRLVIVLAGIGLLAGVERVARVRELASNMLAEELARLGDPQPLVPRRTSDNPE
ncbi:MAG: TetR/AcrR family transcriptional regulator [Solirubrobacteraceae bacterium]|nr:TetR/AcrR family transcriptional regulator [Solirubrobacteraceae bacterium]